MPMEKVLLTGGRIFTLDAERPEAEALYVEKGRIVALGDREEVELQHGRAGVRRIDLQGGFAVPGLVDSHLHLAMFGRKFLLIDFSRTRSKEEMLRLLRERVAKTPPGEWVLGANWDENRFQEGDIPTREELDDVAPGHPVLLTRVCHHVRLANSAAFRAAKVAEDAPDPPRGAYGRDASGRLNGLIYEEASRPFLDAQPRPTFGQWKEMVRQAVKYALSRGLTGAHTDDLRELGSISDTLRIYRELVEEGNPFRTHHLIYHPHLGEAEELGIRAGDGDEWVTVGGVKIFADGSLGGRTALLSRPYRDDPERTGMAVHSREEMSELAGRARRMGYPIAVHAIGDLAAERVIRVLEAIPGEGRRRLPDRLIHASVLRRDLIARLKRLPVVLDIQPRFVAGDFPWVMDRLGPELSPFAYAFKTMLREGLVCAGGSDAPIEPMDPLLGIHAAITRRPPGGEGPPEGYSPGERLIPKEALALFTRGSAFAAGEEKERGTLSAGKWADVTVFDRNPLEVDPEELPEARVMMTLVNGRIGYEG